MLPHKTQRWLLAVVACAAGIAACNDPNSSGNGLPPRDLSAPAAPTAPVTVPDAAQAADAAQAGAAPVGDVQTPPAGHAHALFVRSSRCGECHEKMRLDWVDSGHAKASRSKAYRRSLAAAGDAMRGLCQTCHLPSVAYGQPDEEPNRPSEGVSCDGCHTLSAVQVGKTRAAMTFDPASGKKYGPILGASGHYFHDMAYSVLHTKSEFCAGCHHMTTFAATPGGKEVAIPVASTYADWLRFGKKKPCQDCHMPSRGTEPVARGSKPRPNVPQHLFPGATVLGKNMKFEVSKTAKPGEVAVELSHNAGHMVPSSYVDRRLLVRAEFFAASGARVAVEDHAYGIFLVDDSGQPAPFWRATRIKEDKRLEPGKVYVDSFHVPTVGPAPAPAPGAPAAPATAPGKPPAAQPVSEPVVRVAFSLIVAPTAPELGGVYGEPELAVIKSTTYSLPAHVGGR